MREVPLRNGKTTDHHRYSKEDHSPSIHDLKEEVRKERHCPDLGTNRYPACSLFGSGLATDSARTHLAVIKEPCFA